jgi:2-polyprenyl-3-methyl-5-hydroxy-6-metoxy-1,4-benzoquinol methylase
MNGTDYRETETQALIVLGELSDPIETPNNNSYTFYPKTVQEAQNYFRRFALDLSGAYDALAHRGLVYRKDHEWHLTHKGYRAAREVRRNRPPIWYWYKEFYTAIEHSRAFSHYCERAYGKDLSQHGFSDLDEIHWMLGMIDLDETKELLDIGCGNGRISEYISDATSVRVTGIDYIPEAIVQAERRTASKRDRLRFQVTDIDQLDVMEERFDVILSIDSIFFGQDLTATLGRLKALLQPGGEMAIFCGEDLPTALEQNQLRAEAYDRSKEHHKHLQRKHSVAAEMKEDFELEGNEFIWQVIMAESLDSTVPYRPPCPSRPRSFYRVRRVNSQVSSRSNLPANA